MCHSRTLALRQTTLLLDDLIGTLLELPGHVEAERLGGLHVDHQLKFDRGLNGKVADFSAPEDTVEIRRRAPIIVGNVVSVRHQTAKAGKETVGIHSR